MSNLDTITHFINGAKADTTGGRYADAVLSRALRHCRT